MKPNHQIKKKQKIPAMNQQQLIARWVKATERLPEEHQYDVVVLTNYGKKIADYNADTKTFAIDSYNYSLIKVLEWLEEGEWMQGEGERQWISVNDRLPEVDTKVLVARPNQYSGNIDILIAYTHYSEKPVAYGREFQRRYLKGFYFSLPAITPKEKVTHWMKLPEPPKPQTEHE